MCFDDSYNECRLSWFFSLSLSLVSFRFVVFDSVFVVVCCLWFYECGLSGMSVNSRLYREMKSHKTDRYLSMITNDVVWCFLVLLNEHDQLNLNEMPITNSTHQLYLLYFCMAQKLQIGLQFTIEIFLFQTHSNYMFHNNYMALEKKCILFFTLQLLQFDDSCHSKECIFSKSEWIMTEKRKDFFLQYTTCHVTNTTIKTRDSVDIFGKRILPQIQVFIFRM